MGRTGFDVAVKLVISSCVIGSFVAAELELTAGARADMLLTPEQSEDAALRQELERISKEEPQNADEARKTLQALDQPPSSSLGRQLRNRRERGARRIVNGIYTIRHSAVAALLSGNDPGTASMTCTGTLVGCDKVLTAAHCIKKNPTPNAYLAFFPTLGFFNVKDIAWLKDDYNFPYADLAMLTLARSVEGIAPISLNTAASPINGSVATIVGYGRTGGNRYDYGIKREGSVKFGRCKDNLAGKKLQCWDFDADINVGPNQSNTCNGDSGGGVFMFEKEGQRSVQRVVGVVSGGLNYADCVKGDRSYDTDVSLWKEWLATVGEGRLSAQSCGRGNAVDTPSNLRSQIVTLGPERQEAIFEIEIPASTGLLRVAMSGEDDNSHKNDFDLYLFRGAETTDPICQQNGLGQFAFCEVARPTGAMGESW